MKKSIWLGMIALLLTGCQKESFDTISLIDENQKKIVFNDAVVHDPSIIKAGESYYILVLIWQQHEAKI